MKYGYARVSTNDQKADLQIAADFPLGLFPNPTPVYKPPAQTDSDWPVLKNAG
jgi:hypothetical protein